ncbi:MAG: SgcJ/EcaC family oxidoreductase [Candidatus Acidiferrum sp.]
MFERYTEKARRVIFFARYEASQYGSPFIETEHLLLGLLREDHGLARKFLREKGGGQSIREEIESRITRGERISTSVEMPISEECKRILKMAAEEAERLGSKHVGTEHLLLGILREKDCFAAELLRERGLTLDGLREDVALTQSQAVTGAAEEMVSLAQFVNAWSSGNAAVFAKSFAFDGQFVDLQGNIWVGPARVHEAARLIFADPDWIKCLGVIEDVQFVGAKAVMATLAWQSTQKSEKPNPGCVRMTVILTQKPDGWTIARAQATGLQPQSRTASV